MNPLSEEITLVNPSSMNPIQKIDYIFNDKTGPVGHRFDWLKEALLADVETFENTVTFENSVQPPPKLVRGGGNLSIPIIISTGLELASSMFVGRTSYMTQGQKYNATVNVEKFINEFFSGRARLIPRLIWDGIRNGIDHLFYPKPLQYSQFTIQFTFYRGGDSKAIMNKNSIEMRINISELFNAFRQAVNQYETKLRNDTNLQDNFITAWNSFESYVRKIDPSEKEKSKEALYLIGELRQTNPARLF